VLERLWTFNSVWPIWATPDAEDHIMFIARVSNPDKQDSGDAKLLRYMIKHQHWSPFEMANWCVAIDTTRDVGRQILRHDNHFQEFSQRYASSEKLGKLQRRNARLKHPTKRQLSVACTDAKISDGWLDKQLAVIAAVNDATIFANENDIAPEVARVVLPEGMTPTRMYVNGTIRNWIHYIQSRMAEDTQLEHRQIAKAIFLLFAQAFPIVAEAALGYHED